MTKAQEKELIAFMEAQRAYLKARYTPQRAEKVSHAMSLVLMTIRTETEAIEEAFDIINLVGATLNKYHDFNPTETNAPKTE